MGYNKKHKFPTGVEIFVKHLLQKKLLLALLILVVKSMQKGYVSNSVYRNLCNPSQSSNFQFNKVYRNKGSSTNFVKCTYEASQAKSSM